ncbi:hypothetical protein LCGC14_2491070 [marine sediment metagenome]|uniref:Uncharacterized protein n=1 Tax=marine sediment metagenome TaxID=412755 RepID=A0A0F9B4T7_9ZZZZ
MGVRFPLQPSPVWLSEYFRYIYIPIIPYVIMKVRIHITIDEKLDKRFRDKFVRKKGDYSDKIEMLMKEVCKK